MTPYLLAAISQMTGDQSLIMNKKLIENNAKIGTDVALEYSRLIKMKKHLMENNDHQQQQRQQHHQQQERHQREQQRQQNKLKTLINIDKHSSNGVKMMANNSKTTTTSSVINGNNYEIIVDNNEWKQCSVPVPFSMPVRFFLISIFCL